MELKYLEKYIAENNGVVLYKESNTWDNCYNEWNINYSSILTTLIKEAGKCEAYSSDLFIVWEYSVMKNLKNMIGGEKDYCVFGFRNYGVDGNDFCNCRLRNSDEEYCSIYVVKMEIVERSDGILEMEIILYRYK